MKYSISIFAFVVLCVTLGGATSLLCGESSSGMRISMVNPASPPNLCSYKIEAKNKKICQMRIDFSMTLAQPTFPTAKNGLKLPECIDDFLLIGDLKLCGVEESQHLYVPINRTAGMDQVEIAFKSAQRKGLSKLPPLSWNVEVTQLECPGKEGSLQAPAGCDQYYPDSEGTIRSFNYNDGKGIYPPNLDYVICFRRTTSTVGLLIDAEDFNLPHEVNGTTIFSQIDNFCYPQLPSEGRIEDYLMIPQGQVQENEVRANYFCGQSINGLSVLSTNPAPISLVFHSGSVYQADCKKQGFLLNYQVISG